VINKYFIIQKLLFSVFCRYLPKVRKAVDSLWKKSVFEICKNIFNRNEEIDMCLSVDGAWNKRGKISKLGNFAAIILCKDEKLNGKVLWATTKMKSRKRYNKKTEQTEIIFKGNHSGSSKSMESDGFLELVTWLNEITNENVTSLEKFQLTPSQKLPPNQPNLLSQLNSVKQNRKRGRKPKSQQKEESDEEFDINKELELSDNLSMSEEENDYNTNTGIVDDEYSQKEVEKKSRKEREIDDEYSEEDSFGEYTDEALKSSDIIVPKLKKLIKHIRKQDVEFSHSFKTTKSESLWNVRTSKCSKRVHNWKNYDLRSNVAFLQNNYGKSFVKLLFDELLELW